MAVDHLVDERPVLRVRFTFPAVRIDPGECGAHFLPGPAFLLVTQQAQGLAHNLAGVAKLTRPDLAGYKLLPRRRQGNIHETNLNRQH